MSDFFEFLKLLALCATAFVVVFLVLLSLPQSRLRSVALEVSKYVIAAACAVLFVSPIDFLPLIPIDDIGYLAGGLAAVASARGERQRRQVEASGGGAS